MTLRTLPVFFLLFFGFNPLFANTDSSRVANLIKIINENRSDSALTYSSIERALEIAYASEENRLVADVHIVKGILFYLRSECDSGAYYWDDASSICQEEKDTLLWAKAERLVGVALIYKVDSIVV